uniref:Serine/threonine-specific protein kinase n=1 Tax=Rhizophora mucronata TaxID=61149 RepID=A0A2P2K815_RHIMU
MVCPSGSRGLRRVIWCRHLEYPSILTKISRKEPVILQH